MLDVLLLHNFKVGTMTNWLECADISLLINLDSKGFVPWTWPDNSLTFLYLSLPTQYCSIVCPAVHFSLLHVGKEKQFFLDSVQRCLGEGDYQGGNEGKDSGSGVSQIIQRDSYFCVGRLS